MLYRLSYESSQIKEGRKTDNRKKKGKEDGEVIREGKEKEREIGKKRRGKREKRGIKK